MVQFRKSKKVGPFRVTLTQRGISTSAGAGPVSISRGADGKIRRTMVTWGALAIAANMAIIVVDSRFWPLEWWP